MTAPPAGRGTPAVERGTPASQRVAPGAARMSDADCALLCQLLAVPTVTPLEGGPDACRLDDALDLYAAAAGAVGFVVAHRGAPEPAEVLGDGVPLPVRRAVLGGAGFVAARPAAVPDGAGFLAAQPSAVLRLGPVLPRAATVMFNVHLDTVAGAPPVGFDGVRFRGRGAIDAKGPAVALLAGVRAAVAAEPAVGRAVGVLIQAVSGEEGGGVGTIGTRPLVARGHVGRLNVFCEPTGLRYLPRATAAATAAIRVTGGDAVDDAPDRGHNATVLLGFLAQHLASALAGRDGVCVAGLSTGTAHNRVYGRGQLLVNLAYPTADAGREVQDALAEAVHEGLCRFAAEFADRAPFARTARDCHAVTAVEWLKRDLPTLPAAADDPAEDLLRAAGIRPWPAERPAFTCDAIWLAGVPGAYTVVLGPGELGANHAHADGEYADRADLDAFAAAVARLLIAFARPERLTT